MATPRDLQLVPNAYEVIRLDTGHEICGMTRRVGEVTEITLPMICHLSATFKGSTVATFYPYSPLTSDTVIKIPEDMILHRNTMNPQVIPMYDSASSKWLGMIENQSIPNSAHSGHNGSAAMQAAGALNVLKSSGGHISGMSNHPNLAASNER